MSLYQIRRHIIMWCKRRIYSLHGIHPTFFMAGRSNVSRDLIAGEYGFMAAGCNICPKVTLEKYVMLGPRVVITGKDHRFDIPGVPMIFSGRPTLEPTVIEADVWIGQGVIVMAGTRIGRGSIVAAGSIVTKNIPSFEIHGGVPARKIRNRFEAQEDIQMHDAMLNGAAILGEYCAPLGD